MSNEAFTAALIAAARACLGTPFHHQGREAGAGLDCIGLIVVALERVGYPVRDRRDYGRRPDGQSLLAALTDHGATPVIAPQPGDILVFRFDHQPQHVALMTGPDTMIHSFAPAGRVVETTIGGFWQRRRIGAYRLASVAPEYPSPNPLPTERGPRTA